ncbi:hypothetical protein ACH3WN_28410 [Streptomyces albogriseolus]|uniref:hypothetical protein n=1 Tax=Streptomyces albogriseolus TaxID=1887 RepID=UPI0037A5F270
MRWTVMGIAAVGGVTALALIRSWLELPGVPSDVSGAVASEHVRVLAEGHDSNPGNDWDQTYVLLSVTSNGDPVTEIERALRSAGWITKRTSGNGLVLSGDMPAERPRYGVAVTTYEGVECFDGDEICHTFEETARGHDDDGLFVADFMPYV